MNQQDLVDFGKQVLQEWQKDKAARLAAALAYYMVFALPSLLILALVVAGQFYNTQSVQNQLLAQVGALVGSAGQEVVRAILENASQPEAATLAALAGFLTLLFGASGAFLQLQDTLNTIWEVQPNPEQGIWYTVKTRIFSFALVITVGLLLFASMLLSTFFSAASQFLSARIPQGHLLIQAGHVVISFGVVTLMFALIFKYIPDVKIRWSDVWIGALFTAVLFSLGNWVIGLYLARSAPGSSYGAAGSLIVVMLWIYYSAQILFLGAEFTQVYANRYGSRLVADEHAVALGPDMPASEVSSPATDQPAISQPDMRPLQQAVSYSSPFWQPATLQQAMQSFQRGLINLLALFAAIAGILSGSRNGS